MGDTGLFTLEPLVDAVRSGVESTDWALSGLQKTTSHQFEGRWEGEATRSAYLFFHRPSGPDFAGIDVYLDETSRGLTGNAALVVDLLPLGSVGDGTDALRRLGSLASGIIDPARRRPLTLRLRLPDAADVVAEAQLEVRFKVLIPRATIAAGAGAVHGLIAESVRSFESILVSPEILPFTPKEP